jgi:hypothetical protein
MDTMTFRHFSGMPLPRRDFGTLAAKGQIWVAGGMVAGPDGKRAASRQVDVFSASLGTWQSLPPLQVPRHHPLVAFWNDVVYVLGGFADEDSNAALKIVEAWDATAKRWQRLADLPYGVSSGDTSACGTVLVANPNTAKL